MINDKNRTIHPHRYSVFFVMMKICVDKRLVGFTRLLVAQPHLEQMGAVLLVVFKPIWSYYSDGSSVFTSWAGFDFKHSLLIFV